MKCNILGGLNMSKLFTPFKVKDLTIKNRIIMPPMCMYSSDDTGHVKPWHYIHYTTRAIGQVGLIIVEATAIEKRGRISDKDLGLWDDALVEGLAHLVEEVKKHDCGIGIQLNHAGRKCGAQNEKIIAPSPIPFDESYKVPDEMTLDDIKKVVEAFAHAAKRANMPALI